MYPFNYFKNNNFFGPGEPFIQLRSPLQFDLQLEKTTKTGHLLSYGKGIDGLVHEAKPCTGPHYILGVGKFLINPKSFSKGQTLVDLICSAAKFVTS